MKTECYKYECLSSKGPRRTYARDLNGEAVFSYAMKQMLEQSPTSGEVHYCIDI